MTDNEIIKALECCCKSNCEDCPMNNMYDCAKVELERNVLDFINRIKAEIERLEKEVDRLSQCVLYHDGQIVDAIKDFAEKVDHLICTNLGVTNQGYRKLSADIKKLVKEMEGGTNE